MTSTYRVQLHEEFNFNKLEDILEYLHELGISTIYASPVTRAIKGSQHGYDVIDPQLISPEIGTEQDLEKIRILLQKYEMNWVQDIVPNHMAFETANPWLKDIMAKGKGSEYYHFFDIEADSADLLDNKLMVPFLGKTLTECLQQQEISLDFTDGAFVIRYYQQEYPVAVTTWEWICTARRDCPSSLLTALEKGELSSLDEPSLTFIKEQVSFFNEHISLLKELLDSQHYVLTHSHLAASHINYRRFFTVNSLICLRMEDEKVFETYHRQILSWYKKGLIQGLRLDHIDGLAAPRQYIQRLRDAFGDKCYIVAEKILAAGEPLPEDWPLQGTTGYEFLATVGQLLTDADGFSQLKSFYTEQLVTETPVYKDLVYERKHHFLLTYMGGELDNLVHRAHVPLKDREKFRKTLSIFMSSFPVYRLYPENTTASSLPGLKGPLAAVPEEDRPLLQQALDNPDFLARVMQFTGPLAAKGIEDTVFYNYNPLIARNEVGDSPAVDGLSVAGFHQQMLLRQKATPLSLNAGTTHDTKRGEDARIRIAWLSAIPDEWIATVTKWRELNKGFIQEEEGRPAPLPNDEYFIYQSLLGGLPSDLVLTGQFRQRFHDMLAKALREANAATSWANPNEAYEKKCHAFVDAILDTESPFMEDFFPFAFKCIQEGARYSLSQLLLRLTAPGVPDIYQGSECWDLSFVDPDNRRPVDYGLRRLMLQQIKEAEKIGYHEVLDLVSLHQRRGASKLYTIYKALAYRNAHPEVFTEGEYIPVDIAGAFLAYIRRYRNDWVLVIVPLIRMTAVSGGEILLCLPEEAPKTWTDAFTGESFQLSDAELNINALLNKFPVAMLTSSGAE